MENKIKDYLDTLVLTPFITYQISGNRADQIFCITFFSNADKEVEPIANTLVSAWDKEEDWKFKLRDMYMECIAIVTNDTSLLKDRNEEWGGLE